MVGAGNGAAATAVAGSGAGEKGSAPTSSIASYAGLGFSNFSDNRRSIRQLIDCKANAGRPLRNREALRIQSEPNGILPIRSPPRSVYNRSAQIIFPHTRRTIAGDGSWLTRWMYRRRNRFGESLMRIRW